MTLVTLSKRALAVLFPERQINACYLPCLDEKAVSRFI